MKEAPKPFILPPDMREVFSSIDKTRNVLIATLCYVAAEFEGVKSGQTFKYGGKGSEGWWMNVTKEQAKWLLVNSKAFESMACSIVSVAGFQFSTELQDPKFEGLPIFVTTGMTCRLISEPNSRYFGFLDAEKKHDCIKTIIKETSLHKAFAKS